MRKYKVQGENIHTFYSSSEEAMQCAKRWSRNNHTITVYLCTGAGDILDTIAEYKNGRLKYYLDERLAAQ